MLPQLVSRGFATSRQVVQVSRPTKQLYSVTRAGRTLQRWLEEPPSIEPERAPLLLKIYFGDLLDPEILISHVRKLKLEADALVERLTELERTPSNASLFGDLTVRHGLEWAHAMSRWAEGAEVEIEARLAVPAG